MNNTSPVAIANNNGARSSLEKQREREREKKKRLRNIDGLHVLSVAEIDRRGGGEPGRRLGVEDEADCKRSMKWRNITLAVLRCMANAVDRKSKPWRTLESFIPPRGRVPTVIISSQRRIERATFNDRWFQSFIFSRESRWRSLFENFTLRESNPPSQW